MKIPIRTLFIDQHSFKKSTSDRVVLFLFFIFRWDSPQTVEDVEGREEDDVELPPPGDI
jgi:hypothetical protein